MEYRIRSSGDLKTQGELRQMHPNTSLPKVWDQATLEYLGVDPVFAAPQPTAGELETVYRDGVVQDAKGNWVENWAVGPKFKEYTSENEDGSTTTVTREEQEQAYLADKAATRATEVRATRDKRLAETDWLVIKAFETNTNIPGAWEVYRQALRDVPAQAGFPFEVTWPEKP